MKQEAYRFVPLGLLGIVVGFAAYWNGNSWLGAIATFAVIAATLDLFRHR